MKWSPWSPGSWGRYSWFMHALSSFTRYQVIHPMSGITISPCWIYDLVSSSKTPSYIRVLLNITGKSYILRPKGILSVIKVLKLRSPVIKILKLRSPFFYKNLYSRVSLKIYHPIPIEQVHWWSYWRHQWSKKALFNEHNYTEGVFTSSGRTGCIYSTLFDAHIRLILSRQSIVFPCKNT